MKSAIALVINFSLISFALLSFSEKAFSLTNNEIKKICKKEKSKSTCKRNLLEKKSNLQKGNLIEIPVIPYKK